MSPTDAFRINTSRVAHQTMDGETIIIDFDSGTYFSTTDSGAVIWQQLVHNASVSGIVQTLTQNYVGDEDAIRRGVDLFLVELQREALIEPVEHAPLAPGAPPAAAAPPPAARPAFQPPALNKYTDMQDLLLLDAVHTVDAQGWPIKTDDPAA